VCFTQTLVIMRIAYTEYGKNTDKKRVLFIHGLGASSLSWRDIPYSTYLNAITVDLIGFGDSDKPEEGDYTIKGFSKFIADFLKDEIKIEENEQIGIVGHSLGGYIALQFAIENKKMIEKLVLIASSGMLNGPTPLLKMYKDAAIETDPILRYRKVQRVLEDLYADRSRLLPVVVDTFIATIGQQGAKHAFVSAFENSTTTQIDPQELIQIENIPCLIIWGEEDRLIPLKPINYVDLFQSKFQRVQCERILDAGLGV
jgi:pimeloyl-ACP methyl ester carboxylesterase